MTIAIGYFGTHANYLGESPLWDPARQWLWWIDARTHTLYAADQQERIVAEWRFELPLGAIALASDGLVASMLDGFHHINVDTGTATRIAHVPQPGPGLRFNDGKADRAGRLISGHMHFDGGVAGEVWQLDLDGQARKLFDGVGISNATCFSPDGTSLYYADSLTGLLRRYPYDPATGAIGAREDLVDCRDHGSAPDGATVDAQGRIWVAMVQGQQIACFAPDGALLHKIDLPIPFPSCPAFGGPDLATLYVTTISDSGHRLKSDHPDAGRIIALTGLDATGIAEMPYPLSGASAQMERSA